MVISSPEEPMDSPIPFTDTDRKESADPSHLNIEAIPFSPSTRSEDSGYRSFSDRTPDRFTFDEEVLEMEDSVFEDADQSHNMEQKTVEKPDCIVGMRSRAFSFPMAASDAPFRPVIPFPGPFRATDNAFLRFWASRQSQSSSVTGGHEDQVGFYGLNPSKPSVAHQAPSPSEKNVSLDIAPSVVSMISVTASLLQSRLPDLILSGIWEDFPDGQSPSEFPESLDAASYDSIEFRIASRLAKLGDEFDGRFFGKDRGADLVDASAHNGWGFFSLFRLWKYLSRTTDGKSDLIRQRSLSTSD